MSGIATVSIYCPPMSIDKISRKLRRTAVEPMVVTVVMPDGSVLTFKDVTIPPTDVNAVRDVYKRQLVDYDHSSKM